MHAPYSQRFLTITIMLAVLPSAAARQVLPLQPKVTA
jgi:hypothetical protein